MVTFEDSQLQLIAWFLPALLVYYKERKCEATSETPKTWSLASSCLRSRVELQMVRMVDRWKIRQISAGYGGRGSGEGVFEYIMREGMVKGEKM